jgi:prepilin-type N-terminal cleavage/methylation domain-containing protein
MSVKHLPYKHGFTIVELLIVIVVIAILAAISIVAYNGIQQRALASSLQADLSSAIKTLKLYHADYGFYPTSINPTTYCPTPADTNYCLKTSSGNQFLNYTVDSPSNPQSITLDAQSSNGARYYASSSGGISESADTFTMAAISGTLRTGSTLTAGALTPSGATVTRQWQRSTSSGGTYTNITGAINNTYAIPTGDRGYYLRIVATGTGGYNGVVTSAPTGLITTAVTAIGAISGTTTVGSTLTAGAVTPSGATVSYQWRRNGTNISGATAATYVLTAADQGTVISVVATGTGQYSLSATSANTATIN